MLPKKPISELNSSQENGNLKLSVNADGWVVALAKNKETIEEVKEKIEEYISKSPESDKKEELNKLLKILNTVSNLFHNNEIISQF